MTRPAHPRAPHGGPRRPSPRTRGRDHRPLWIVLGVAAAWALVSVIALLTWQPATGAPPAVAAARLVFAETGATGGTAPATHAGMRRDPSPPHS